MNVFILALGSYSGHFLHPNIVEFLFNHPELIYGKPRYSIIEIIETGGFRNIENITGAYSSGFTKYSRVHSTKHRPIQVFKKIIFGHVNKISFLLEIYLLHMTVKRKRYSFFFFYRNKIKYLVIFVSSKIILILI